MEFFSSPCLVFSSTQMMMNPKRHPSLKSIAHNQSPIHLINIVPPCASHPRHTFSIIDRLDLIHSIPNLFAGGY